MIKHLTDRRVSAYPSVCLEPRFPKEIGVLLRFQVQLAMSDVPMR
jgi:hypothetical protein